LHDGGNAFAAIGSRSMARFPTTMGDFKPCDNTASAALINGWINSIFIN